MRLISFLAVSVLALMVLTACNSAEWKNAKTSAGVPASNAPTHSDGVRRVTVSELKELLASNGAYVIDVRNQVSYDAGHIKGSRLIPETEVKNHFAEMPKDKLIVTYCSWPNEHTSARAVVDLRDKGVTNAGALLGGYAAALNAGLPIDKKAASQ